jgi:pimeloyl-ACP methyl ester carboxylesterase
MKQATLIQATPFNIAVPQNVLDDLYARLKQTRWTDEPANAGWHYGTNPTYLRELVEYWQTKYDWRKQEAMLNQFPQYISKIDGIDIHFIYIKGKGANAKPLILTHEWPDSFQRFYKVIPMLTDPASHGGNADESFDLIIPSIPGHGFSGHQSVTSDRTAGIWASLMKDVLGYTHFYAAGDWAVTKALALKNPGIVKGIHLTDTGYPNGTEDWSKLSPAEQQFGQSIQGWFFAEGAFNMIQSTKPQTLGYGLNDSPVGLASWIIEKFYSWSDTKGDMENSFTKDELLTNIMIYWVSQTINTSIRRYLEDTRALYAQGMPKPDPRVEVPTAVAIFPGDSQTPREWADRRVNVTRYNKMPKGGRFAALEVPELWVNDVRAFFWGDLGN